MVLGIALKLIDTEYAEERGYYAAFTGALLCAAETPFVLQKELQEAYLYAMGSKMDRQ